MQNNSKNSIVSRLGNFLQSPQGQIFATWCAYSALACFTISVLLLGYSRLAWPFAIVTPFLAYLGIASRSHRRTAQVALALWVILGNYLFPMLLNLSDQVSQQSKLQQQIIQLENQYNELQNQEKALEKQVSLFQAMSNQTKDADKAHNLPDTLQQTTDNSLSLIKGVLGDTNSLLSYDIWLLQNNDRNLESNSEISRNEQTLQNNDQQIQLNRGVINTTYGTISVNNMSLSPTNVQAMPTKYQKDCVSGYPCNVQLSWQQPFINGWQRITREPLSTTWSFWLSLLVALPGLFFLLPRVLSRRWIVTYRVLYSGTLASLNDPAFPAQKRQELTGDSFILKVDVRSTLVQHQQKGQGDELQEFLSLNLGPGTTILDVFLKQNANQPGESLQEVYYDAATGNIVLKVKPLAIARNTSRKASRRALRRFPIQFYIVVDYFAGSIEATTPIAGVERLQERRGPIWLIRTATGFRELVWWLYASGFYWSLMMCSTTFFDTVPFPPSLFSLALGSMVTGIVLHGGEFTIMRATTRQQKVLH